jgi:hypothetical protein
MAQAKYYSPRLDRDLISRLYHQAQSEGVPMTPLASRLVRQGLANQNCATTRVVAEEPPANDPSGRK